MKQVYIFDIDGTLTPARTMMENDFAQAFRSFCIRNDVYLVTGSDYSKVLEQVPEDILKTIKLVFSCAGAVCHRNGQIEYTKTHEFSKDLLSDLNHYLDSYEGRKEFPSYGNHIEFRTGMLNFSLCGRNIPHADRPAYIKWEKGSQIRQKVAHDLRQAHPQYDFTIGGDISIDIAPKGFNKAMIIPKLDEETQGKCQYVFIANRILGDGNDAPLAEAIHHQFRGYSIQVEYPFTHNVIQNLY